MNQMKRVAIAMAVACLTACSSASSGTDSHSTSAQAGSTSSTGGSGGASAPAADGSSSLSLSDAPDHVAAGSTASDIAEKLGCEDMMDRNDLYPQAASTVECEYKGRTILIVVLKNKNDRASVMQLDGNCTGWLAYGQTWVAHLDEGNNDSGEGVAKQIQSVLGGSLISGNFFTC